MAKLKTKTCGNCGGSGSVPDDNVGAGLREEREKAGVTMKDMAEALNISASYLTDLERDNRRWTNELMESYQVKLEALRNA